MYQDMKKVVLILILVVCGNALLAQAPKTMDTIIGRELTYFYQRWFDSVDFLHAQTCRKMIVGYGGVELAKYNYTDSALKVVGIAAYVWARYDGPGLPWEPRCADTTFDNWYENFILYKPTDTGMVMLATQRYSVLDTTRWMRLYYNVDYYMPNSDSVYVGYFPIYEAYFDEPVTVTDSFYVATTGYHGVVDSQSWTYPGPRPGTGCYSNTNTNKPCYWQHYMWKNQTTGFQWRYAFSDQVLIVFPIIDTTQPRCWRPVGLNVQSQDSSGVYLAWEGGENNQTWEVAYGRADEEPNGYATRITSSPAYTLTGLTAGVEYAVRLRAICFDNTMYSSWTDTICFNREGEPLDIVVPDNNIGNIQLMPNPASGNVMVLSPLEIELIEVYDEKGTRVLEQKERNHTTSVGFDVSKWAKGTYVVVVHTPSGTTTKRLVVN